MTAEYTLPALPTHCAACGAVLKGGATEHKPECEIRKLIEENFPKVANDDQKEA